MYFISVHVCYVIKMPGSSLLIFAADAASLLSFLMSLPTNQEVAEARGGVRGVRFLANEG